MADSHREEIAKLEALYAGNPGGRVFVHLAEAYRKAGEHERARRILDEGLARHADSASGYVVLGRVLADMHVMDEAEVAFRRVLELDGGNLVALRWLGDLARQSGRTDEAITHYRELLARNPSNEEVRDLVEIVEREAATGVSMAPAEEEPEWQEPEPAEQVAETPEEPLTPLSAAPGRTGDEESADVEFGLVEIESISVESDAVPAHGEETEPEPSGEPAEEQAGPDLISHAERAEGPGPFAAGEEGAGAAEVFAADDSLIIESAGEDGFEELSDLARSDETDGLEIHLLDPSYTGDEESGEEYADDEFIADLMGAGSEPPEEDSLEGGTLDVLGSSSPLTLQGDEADAETTEPGETEAASAAGISPVTEPSPAEVSPREPTFAGEISTEPASSIAEPWSAEAPPAAAPSDELEPVSPEPAEPRADEAEEAQGLVAAYADAVEPPPLKPHGDDLAAAALGGVGAEPGPVTETMAELYRAQGFHERAAEVYRALLRQRPFDLRLSEKLSEAEADAAAARAETAAERVAAEPEDEAAGEVWLRGVGAPWDAGAAETTQGATPYAWTGEPDEAPPGQPISSYLRDLVAWKTASQRWAETPPPAPPAPSQSPQQAPWSPDDEPWAAAPVDESWGTTEQAETVNPWGTDAQGETGSPWGEPAASTPEAGTGEELPWGGTPGAESQPAQPQEPADPWLQAAPGSSVEPPSAQPAGNAGDGTEEATQAWTPLDAEAAAASASTGEQGEEDESDDEDLEMFRSWLQSLKK